MPRSTLLSLQQRQETGKAEALDELPPALLCSSLEREKRTVQQQKHTFQSLRQRQEAGEAESLSALAKLKASYTSMRQRQEAVEEEVHEFKQALAQMERKVGAFQSLSRNCLHSTSAHPRRPLS